MSYGTSITEQTPYAEFKQKLEEEIVKLKEGIEKALQTEMTQEELKSNLASLKKELEAHVDYHTFGEKIEIAKNVDYKDYIASAGQRIDEILEKATQTVIVKPSGEPKKLETSPDFTMLDALDTEIDALIIELTEGLTKPTVVEIEQLVGNIVQKQNDLFQKFLDSYKSNNSSKITSSMEKALKYTREIVLDLKKNSDVNKNSLIQAFSSVMNETTTLRSQIMTRFGISNERKDEIKDERKVVLEFLSKQNFEDILAAFRSKKPLNSPPLPTQLPTPTPSPLQTPTHSKNSTPIPSPSTDKQTLIESIKAAESDTDELNKLLKILNEPCDKTKLLIVLDFLLNTSDKKKIYQLLINYVKL